jgi:polyisoprenoid-binding protein YceI
MKNISKSIILIGIISLFAFKNHLGSRKIVAEKSTSSVTYSMTHTMHDWDGVSKDVNAIIVYNDDTKAIEQVAVSIPVASFDSGNSNRDSHAIEAMEGLKFPKVTFSSSDVKSDGGNFTAKGNLTFHGISKAVEIKGTRKETGNKLAIDGGFEFLLSDYKVEAPSLLGIKADNQVKMKLKVNFVLK